MTNATTKSSFLATPKSDILCNTNTEVQHGNLPFLQSEISAFFATKNFCCKKCWNFWLQKWWTSVLHKMSDFGVVKKLSFVVASVIVADTSPWEIKKYFKGCDHSLPEFVCQRAKRREENFCGDPKSLGEGLLKT